MFIYRFYIYIVYIYIYIYIYKTGHLDTYISIYIRSFWITEDEEK